MLSDECKINVYPNLESFNENYINVVFKNKKTTDIQSWIEDESFNTYLVKYSGDIISTGNTEAEEFEDYITVDTEKQKLNINRYIRKEEIGKEKEKNNIKFTFNYVDIYKDYEIYNIKIENKSNNEIILDNLDSVSSTYIETDNETKINCSNFEAGLNSFKYEPGVTKTIKLKVIKQYNTDVKDEKIVFSSAILDTSNMEEKEEISIEL